MCTNIPNTTLLFMIFDNYFDEYCEKLMFTRINYSEMYIFSNQINISSISKKYRKLVCQKLVKTTGNVHNLNLGPAKMRGRGVYLSHFQLVPMGTNCRILKIGGGYVNFSCKYS